MTDVERKSFRERENCCIISGRGSHTNPRRLRQTELDLGTN